MADALKDIYDVAWIDELAAAANDVEPGFDGARFVTLVFDEQWERRELKQRMRHIATSLAATLPDDYEQALSIVRRVADRLGPIGLRGMLFPDFVECFGRSSWQASIDALEHLTRFSSSEYAIRPFILDDPLRTMAVMQRWALNDNEHVRRLASEGCRPRLPWAQALPMFKADPSPVLPILALLVDDPSEYVRRSVANNLNDIAKDHPDVVVDVLASWLAEPTPQRMRLARHALRSLIKSGHPKALALLGFPTGAAVVGTDLTVRPDVVAFGSDLEFQVTLTSTGPTDQSLAVDYAIEFARPSGKPGRKVFKLTTASLAAGESIHLSRRFSFRPITTRRYYAGPHAVEIQVNGAMIARAGFTVDPETGTISSTCVPSDTG